MTPFLKVTAIGWIACSAAISWIVLRPLLITSMVTPALNLGLWVRRLLIGGSPGQGRCPVSEVNEGVCSEKPDHLNLRPICRSADGVHNTQASCVIVLLIANTSTEQSAKNAMSLTAPIDQCGLPYFNLPCSAMCPLYTSDGGSNGKLSMNTLCFSINNAMHSSDTTNGSRKSLVSTSGCSHHSSVFMPPGLTQITS